MAGDEHGRDGKGRGAGDASTSEVDPDAVTRLTDEAEEATFVADADDEGGDAATIVKTPPPPVSPDEGEDKHAGVDVNAPTRVSDRAGEHTPPAADGRRASPIRPGTVLFGEYEIEAVLGAGGMGEVFRARHRRLDELRAIKMMLAELSGKKGANEFFLREAKALLAVRHPAVVHCHDLLSDEHGRIFLIMEMIEGISLSERIDEGPLSPDDVLLLGARIAAGLSAAHACGVVHRDISPDNIVLPDGDVSRAKLIDFGIAKLLEQGQGTIVDGFKGKLSYASPEQLGFFGGRIDGRSDLYSLGLVLCAAALGKPLGMGRTVVEAVDARREFRHVPDQIPAGLRATIEPLLALDPADRPRYVERLFAVPGAPATQSATEAGEVRGHPASGRGTRLWVPIVAAAALAAGIAGYLLVPGETPAPPAPTETNAQRSDTSPGVARTSPPPAAPPPTKTARAAEPAPIEKTAAPAAPRKRQVSALDRLRVTGLLRGAETALEENRLQSPKGDNAYEKYRSVLEIDPDNAAAKRGLVDVAGRYLALCEGALASGDLDQARTYLGRAASIAPHHPRLPAVREALAKASPGSAPGG